MKDIKTIINTIKAQGIIPLFYDDDVQTSIDVVDALYNAGVRIIEYTNRGENALKNCKALLQKRGEHWNDLIISAGTIKTVEDAEQFIQAGADFIICPGVIPDVGNVVLNAGLLWVPGCMTATEIMVAEQNGAQLVKIFPGSLLGPNYITAIKEIFPNLMFMPTGGVEVNKENMGAWFKAGVVAVGLGSKVISKELLQRKDYAAIGSLAKKALEIVKDVRKN